MIRTPCARHGELVDLRVEYAKCILLRKTGSKKPSQIKKKKTPHGVFSFFSADIHKKLHRRKMNKKIGSNYTRDWVQALPAGRGDKIRTCDFYVPNVALYQAEPHLDIKFVERHALSLL